MLSGLWLFSDKATKRILSVEVLNSYYKQGLDIPVQLARRQGEYGILHSSISVFRNHLKTPTIISALYSLFHKFQKFLERDILFTNSLQQKLSCFNMRSFRFFRHRKACTSPALWVRIGTMSEQSSDNSQMWSHPSRLF